MAVREGRRLQRTQAARGQPSTFALLFAQPPQLLPRFLPAPVLIASKTPVRCSSGAQCLPHPRDRHSPVGNPRHWTAAARRQHCHGHAEHARPGGQGSAAGDDAKWARREGRMRRQRRLSDARIRRGRGDRDSGGGRYGEGWELRKRKSGGGRDQATGRGHLGVRRWR